MTTKTDMKRCPMCEEFFPMNLAVCPVDRTMLMSFSHASSDLKGQVLNDRYQIDEVLHNGQSGTICKATHALMDRTVCIKVMNEGRIHDRISVGRFQQEAQACSHLQHPCIVPIYDYGFLENGRPYLVMDLVAGTTLDTIVEKEGPLEPARFRKLFRGVCSALAYMHKMGVIHRDLKPNHIMVSRLKPDDVKIVGGDLNIKAGDELPVLLDFGVCKLLPASGRQAQELTQVGEQIGTPLWMSPEQCMAHSVDFRSDVYTLGCIMYYALTGVPPLQGTSVLDTMQMKMSSKPNPDALPRVYRDIVLKAMEVRPDDRIQSAEELFKALG